MGGTEHEILTVLDLCNSHEGEAAATFLEVPMLAGCDAPCTCREQCWGQGRLHGLGALLEVAHPADGFGLRDQLAVAPMNHLVVRLPAAAVLGELEPWGKTLLLPSGLADLTEFQMNCTNSVKGCSRNCRGTCYQRRNKQFWFYLLHKVLNIGTISSKPIHMNLPQHYCCLHSRNLHGSCTCKSKISWHHHEESPNKQSRCKGKGYERLISGVM